MNTKLISQDSDAKVDGNSKYQDLLDNTTLVDGLKQRSVRGGLFSMGGSGINFALRLSATYILARILLPEHFGLIGMVTAITAIAETFKDFGLSVATIQKKTITHQQVSALFWINALVGLTMTALICCLSVFIGWFYKDSRLILITLALSTSFLWSGLAVQHQAILWRKMRFARLAVVDTLATLLSIVLAVVLALRGFGVWALVSQQVSRSFFFAIGTWLVCPWRPGPPGRTEGIGKMMKMGGDLTAFNLITFFADNLDFMLIGKTISAEALGIYRQGSQLALLPVSFIQGSVHAVAPPALRVLLTDVPRYRAYYKKILSSMTFVNMPGMLFLFIYAREIVMLLLGDKWTGAIAIFQIFALAGFIRPAISTAGFIMISCGLTRRYLFIGVLNSVFIILGIVVGLQWGLIGIALGTVIANYIFFLPVAYVAFRNTPVSVGLFVTAIFPSFLCSVTMGLVAKGFSSLNLIQNSNLALAASFAVASASYLLAWALIPGGKTKLRELYTDFSSVFRARA